ncbi:unnamed protein product [Amoebophrya sp. A25]|nr:unnamed protein product [Amoebophrya sp. A25]|eukprot:GSA25T00007675001.1
MSVDTTGTKAGSHSATVFGTTRAGGKTDKEPSPDRKRKVADVAEAQKLLQPEDYKAAIESIRERGRARRYRSVPDSPEMEGEIAYDNASEYDAVWVTSRELQYFYPMTNECYVDHSQRGNEIAVQQVLRAFF